MGKMEGEGEKEIQGQREVRKIEEDCKEEGGINMEKGR